MKLLNMKLLLIIVMIFSSVLHANEREHKIRLMGKVKDSTPKRITVKELEKGLKFVEEKVYNPYEEREYLYGGVLFNDFVAKYAKSDVMSVKLMTIDDYTIVIDKNDWETMRIILSTKLNQRYIPVKLKGPLITVFPDYDSKKKEYRENISKWVWMIKKIEFR